MNKITIALVTCATSVAFAQAPAKTPAPAPAKDAKAPAADAKAPAAPAKMEMQKPPAEVADMGKKMAGTWNCTGEMMDMTDATKMIPSKSKMVWKLDADKAWIVGTLTEGKMKMTLMQTWDTVTKKWYRVATDSTGGSETAWASSQVGPKTVFEGEGRGMGMPAWKSRTTEEMASDKEVKLTGEMSMDGGKKWVTSWTADCKK